MVGAMANLQQLLALLGRPDVSQVLLQTGAPPYARMGQELKALSRQNLTMQHLMAFFQGTPAEALIRQAHGRGAAAGELVLHGARFAVEVTHAHNQTRIRLGPAPSPAAAPAPEPIPVPAMTAPAQTPPTAASRPPTPAVARGSAATGRNASSGGYPAMVAGARTEEQLSQALADLLAEARTRGASDVHLMSGQPARMRVVGRLQAHGPELDHGQVQGMLTPLFSESHRQRFDELGYADLAADFAGGRLRININRQRGGWKGCFRLVAAGPSPLAELGLPDELAKITVHHQGLVVVSGPSASGKTTTMAALVHLFNETRPVHIITVEDPVEIVHPIRRALVTQREVGAHTKSFYKALKGSLREDPDIIVIGELRDRETVEMALSAAETGHLVLATMSTPSGARTIDRLIDMFPPDVQSQVRATLAGALKLVISQRLVASADGMRQIAAAEMITGNVPLWSLIRDNKLFQLPSLLQRGRAYGMIRIEDSLNQLIANGAITVEEARRHADDPKAIQSPSDVARRAAAEAEKAQTRRGGLGGLFRKKD